MRHQFITHHQHTMHHRQTFTVAADHNLLVVSVVQVDLVVQMIAGLAEQVLHVLAQLASK
jgi:hypothetical protein